MADQRAAETDRMHVLAVDDEAMSTQLMARIFEDEPAIRLTTTNSPEAALEIAARDPVDLLITDHKMPGMTGVDLLVRMRALKEDCICIVLTAYPDVPSMVRAVNEGRVYRFLTKPCDPEDIRVTVVRALESLALARENRLLTDRLREQNGRLQRALRDLEATQAELVRSEKMAVVGRISASLAHELASPVTVLYTERDALERCALALIERAKGTVDDRRSIAVAGGEPTLEQLAEELRESLGLVGDSCRHIRSLVIGLRTYSHPGRGEPEPWDLRGGIDAALRLQRHRLKGCVDVTLDLDEIPALLCRGQEITQVLMNLIANAADALEDGTGSIHIGSRVDDGWAVISVTDNGCGMDAATLQRLNQAFFTTKPVGLGSGLGLAICRQILKAHGGRLEIESTPGRGSTFRVLLPLPEAASGKAGARPQGLRLSA